jgi:hypothetical protein
MSRPDHTRGARKLDAALAELGLAEHVTDSDAIDVGARRRARA